MNTWTAVGAATVGMDVSNAQLKGSISLCPRGWGASAPGVEATARDAENPAHDGDRELGLVRHYELEDSGGSSVLSRANQAAAFFRISFS